MSGLLRTFCIAVILFAVLVLVHAAPAPLAHAADEPPPAPDLVEATAASASVAITPRIVSSFTVPGNRALAITWANDSLWLADANKDIYRLNVNGEVQLTFPITFTPYGLAWDGSNLWSGDDTGVGGLWRAFQLDASGRVINRLSEIWGGYNIGDLAWVGNYLYAAQFYSSGDIHRFDQQGKSLLSWNPDFIGLPRGMAADGTGLWIGEECFGDARNELYRYTFLGERLNKIDLNAIDIKCNFNTQTRRGLAWDGRFLWYTGDDIFMVYKLDVGVPDITLSATSLNFGTQALNTTSAQTVTVQNTGGNNIPIGALTVSGDYALDTTCPTGGTLAAGARCAIRVSFTPVSIGARPGAITLTHYADVRPNLISLSGAGATPSYTLLPGSLNFGDQVIGTTSAAKNVTLQNTGSGQLPISAITISGDYNQTNDCPPVLSGGTSCTIAVTFAPQGTGSRNGTLTVTIHPTISLSTVALNGAGINLPSGQFILQVNKVGNGQVDVTPPGPYNSGQSVTLTARPDSGWTFSGWGGDLTGGNNPATLVINKNSQVVANFSATCFALTRTHSGAGSDPLATPTNSPTCTSGQYAAGSLINLTADPADGWQVQGWSGAASAGNTIHNSLTMPAQHHTVSVAYTETQALITHTWTLLIYAVGDNDLGQYMTTAITGTLLARLQQAGRQPSVNVGVLYDGPGANDTVRYILSQDGGWNPFPLPAEARMDEPGTLRSFIEWGFDTFKSDYYYLSIVDHASGVLGIGVDRTTDSAGQAFLTPSELREAIYLGAGTGAHKLAVVHFDGCSFGLLENASIVQDLADYVIASPNTGWGIFAYDAYRQLAGAAPNDPRAFAQAVARHYGDKVGAQGRPYTVSVFDMAQFVPVRDAVDQLGRQLDAYTLNNATQQEAVRAIRSVVQKYDSDDYQLTELDRYVDLRHLAVALQAQNVASEAAREVERATQSFVLLDQHASGTFRILTRTLTMTLTSAQGVGIYYPYSRSANPGAYQRYISNKLFPNLTTNWGWTTFLARGVPVLQPPEPEQPEQESLLSLLLDDPGVHSTLFLPVIARQ